MTMIGLKGIFIDIDSGEVNVLKPVAELTSFEPKKESSEEEYDEYEDGDGDGIADADMKKKQEIFDQIQTELKKNYDKMKKAHERAEAKKRRKEALVAKKAMVESMDVVSKYFDMVDDTDETKATKPKTNLKTRVIRVKVKHNQLCNLWETV
jgi:small-conductance mechanosensitive channel